MMPDSIVEDKQAPTAIDTDEASVAAGAAILSSDESPQIDGSKLHGTLNDEGQPICTPCAWFHKEPGCANGKICQYCHLCPKGELKNRKKAKIARSRRADDGSSPSTAVAAPSSGDAALGRCVPEKAGARPLISRAKSGSTKTNKQQAKLSFDGRLPQGASGLDPAAFPGPLAFDPMAAAWMHAVAMNPYGGYPGFPLIPPMMHMGMPPSPGVFPPLMVPPSTNGFSPGPRFPSSGAAMRRPLENPRTIREDGSPLASAPPESPQNMLEGALPVKPTSPPAVSFQAEGDCDAATSSRAPPGLESNITRFSSSLSVLSEAAMDDMERTMTPAVQIETTEGGIIHVRWTITTNKLKSTDKQVVSPPFGIPWIETGADSFRMMMHPAIVNNEKGGASFKRAKGRGVVKLKCEESLENATAAVVRLRIAILCGTAADADAQEELPRGPVTCDFAAHGICGLPVEEEEWDLKAAAGGSPTFVVCLELLPPGLDLTELPPGLIGLNRSRSDHAGATPTPPALAARGPADDTGEGEEPEKGCRQS